MSEGYRPKGILILKINTIKTKQKVSTDGRKAFLTDVSNLVAQHQRKSIDELRAAVKATTTTTTTEKKHTKINDMQECLQKRAKSYLFFLFR